MSRNMINSAIQRYMAENGLDFEQLADAFNASKVVTEYNHYLDLLKDWCRQNGHASLPDMGSLPGDPPSEEEAKIAAETSPIIAARLYFDRFVMTSGQWKKIIEAGFEAVPLSTIFDRRPIRYTEDDIGRAYDEEQFQFYGDQLIFDIVDELCPGFLDQEEETRFEDQIPILTKEQMAIIASQDWGIYVVEERHEITLLSIGDFNDPDVEALRNIGYNVPILVVRNPEDRMEADYYIAWLVVSKQRYDLARWQEEQGMTPLADSPLSIENRLAEETAWSDSYLNQAAHIAGLQRTRG